jgi:acyl-coenzyme A synthetase/AMP-(fatty) acid ligase
MIRSEFPDVEIPNAPEEVTAFVAERVAPYKKVRAVALVEEIPKSPSGKILRRLLIDRERALAASA